MARVPGYERPNVTVVALARVKGHREFAHLADANAPPTTGFVPHTRPDHPSAFSAPVNDTLPPPVRGVFLNGALVELPTPRHFRKLPEEAAPAGIITRLDTLRRYSVVLKQRAFHLCVKRHTGVGVLELTRLDRGL